MSIILLLFVGILGACIGSFLNVVIYRLPLMLEQDWRSQCLALLEQPAEKHKPFNLSFPRSHCPYCKKNISIWDNIPLISYILLRGKCRHCHHKISWRYPLVELLTAITTLTVVSYFGWHWQTLAALLFTWALIVLIFIDFAVQLLPDDINLGLLWLGLFCSLFGFFTTPAEALIGAIVGYSSLWLVALIFKKLRGIDGMGYGDFKLFACLGAWFGWKMLPFILFSSSLLGLIVAISLLSNKKIKRNTPLAFGPYLAAAGWAALFFGKDITNYFFHGLLF